MRRDLAFIILIASSTKIFDCAKESERLGRIVRGHDAVIGQFPYAVRLKVKVDEIKMGCLGCITYVVEDFCGGALISPTWILTAAHCVADTESVEVSLGSISRYRGKVVYDVPSSKIRIHPRFNNSSRNDIALLKIPHTNLCLQIGIIPLPKVRYSQPKYGGAIALACGWGRKSEHKSLPRILQWGRLQILPSEECQMMGIIETQICTIISPDFATVSYGDSGGPLVLEATGELVGIASAGDSTNCENGNPAIFTRVTSYLNWIKSVSGISY